MNPREAPQWSARRRAQLCAALSYGGLIALYVRVTWGLWRWHDLSSGDTPQYFRLAWTWYADHAASIVWSPLYTIFYGSFLFLTEDAYAVTTAHRLVIGLLAALLLLSVARILLPEPIAWLVAAWWTVLPINYDTLSEVHLFAALPLFLVYRLAFPDDTRWRRGVVLACLLASTLLVRYEHLFVAAGAGAVFAALEAAAWSRREIGVRGLARAYGWPCLAALLVFSGVLALSSVRPVDVPRVFARKHTHNFCQSFAFGYQQRHPEWTRSPWVDCEALMREQFGEPQPTFLRAGRARPGAILEHLAWNARLIPSGLQALLFDRMSGSVNPDYAPVSTARWVLPASVALLVLVGAGVWRIGADADLRRRVFAQRKGGWGVVAGVAVMSVVVMMTQRPRPSYLFGLSAAIMLACGLAVTAVTRGRPEGSRRTWIALLAVIGAVLIVAPVGGPARAGEIRRPALEAYRRLRPFGEAVQAKGQVLVARGHGDDACNYLPPARGGRCRDVHYYAVRPPAPSGEAWARALAAHAANVFYADEVVMGDPHVRDFLDAPGPWGWRDLGAGESPRGRWRLLVRD